MITEKQFYTYLENIASLVAETFGSNCEVVVSDVNDPDHAIKAIFNGHVTGRKIGDPLQPFAKERVDNAADGYYINYMSQKGGKMVKSSTLATEIGEMNVAFCINYDCAEIEKMRAGLNEFLTMQTDETLLVGGQGVYAPSIEQAVIEAITNIGKPVALMTKKDRLQIIEYLESKGVLKMQKSIQAIAQYLGISRYTVYNYLNELNLTDS